MNAQEQAVLSICCTYKFSIALDRLMKDGYEHVENSATLNEGSPWCTVRSPDGNLFKITPHGFFGALYEEVLEPTYTKRARVGVCTKQVALEGTQGWQVYVDGKHNKTIDITADNQIVELTEGDLRAMLKAIKNANTYRED